MNLDLRAFVQIKNTDIIGYDRALPPSFSHQILYIYVIVWFVSSFNWTDTHEENDQRTKHSEQNENIGLVTIAFERLASQIQLLTRLIENKTEVTVVEVAKKAKKVSKTENGRRGRTLTKWWSRHPHCRYLDLVIVPTLTTTTKKLFIFNFIEFQEELLEVESDTVGWILPNARGANHHGTLPKIGIK